LDGPEVVEIDAEEGAAPLIVVDLRRLLEETYCCLLLILLLSFEYRRAEQSFSFDIVWYNKWMP